MPPLVTNMGHQKKPWQDVPIEVLIEYERKKREERERQREQLRLPLHSPAFPAPTKPHQQDIEEEHKITINFV